MREYRFYVYILQSNSRRALYIGMTNNLRRRVYEHKTHEFTGFTQDYDAGRLVYWQQFETVQAAISREKQLKGWRRGKKLALITTMNPGWKDLAAGWYGKAELKRIENPKQNPSKVAIKLHPSPDLSSRAKPRDLAFPAECQKPMQSSG